MDTLRPPNQRATVGHHPGVFGIRSLGRSHLALGGPSDLPSGGESSCSSGAAHCAMRTVPQTTTHASAVTSWRERAENVDQVTASLGSVRPAVQDAVVAEGAGALQLANPDWETESITLAPAVLPAEGTKLFFESRIGHATSTQFARLQVSADNGANWTNLWSRAGSEIHNWGHILTFDISRAAVPGFGRGEACAMRVSRWMVSPHGSGQ